MGRAGAVSPWGQGAAPAPHVSAVGQSTGVHAEHLAHWGLFPSFLPSFLPLFFATQSKQPCPCPIWLMIWEINPAAITGAPPGWGLMAGGDTRGGVHLLGGSHGKAAPEQGLCLWTLLLPGHPMGWHQQFPTPQAAGRGMRLNLMLLEYRDGDCSVGTWIAYFGLCSQVWTM